MNIGGDINDEFYRYKMPNIDIQHTKTKTIITNITDIIESIKRNEIYLQKYIGYELGARVLNKNYRFEINGKHDKNKIIDIVNSFIKLYVLCIECGLPETNISICKNKAYFDCRSCGKSCKLPNNKLLKVIINHPNDKYNVDFFKS